MKTGHYKLAAADTVPDVLYLLGPEGRVRYSNVAVKELLGYDVDELVGEDFWALIHPQDLPELQPKLDTLLRGHLPSSQNRVRLKHRLGNWVHVMTHATVSEVAGEKVVVGTLRDLREQVRLEQELHEANQFLQHLIESSPGVVFRREGLGLELTYVSSNVERVYGWKAEEILGKPQSATLARIHPDDHQSFEAHIASALDTGSSEAEYRSLTPLGRAQWVQSTLKCETNDPDHPVLLGFLLDIDDQKREELDLEHLAYHDALTVLPNRASFERAIQDRLARAKRKKQRVALLYLDLDGFKELNDRHGHDAGDDLLREFAECLRTSIREEDLAARLGGDEFVLLLCNADEAIVDQVTGRIGAVPLEVDGRAVGVRASIGVSFYPHDGESAEELLRKADKAMYRAKQMARV